jgi:hypothetical protein
MRTTSSVFGYSSNATLVRGIPTNGDSRQNCRVAGERGRVVHAGLPAFQHALQPHRTGDVTGHRNRVDSRGTGDLPVDVRSQRRIHLDEVVPRPGLALDLGASLRRSAKDGVDPPEGRIAVQPVAAGEDGGSQPLARGHLAPELQDRVGRAVPAEVPDGGNAVGEVEQQILRVEQVDVHVGEAGHQVLAAAVDPERATGHGKLGRRADRRDPAIANQDSLMLYHALAVDGDQADVGERGLVGLARGGRREEWEDEENRARRKAVDVMVS